MVTILGWFARSRQRGSPSPIRSAAPWRCLAAIARSRIEQRFDERALGRRALGAASHHVDEHPFHRPQVLDLGAQVGEMGRRHLARLGAGPVALLRELQERPDLVEGETDVAGAAEQVYEHKWRPAEEPVAAPAARGRRPTHEPPSNYNLTAIITCGH